MQREAAWPRPAKVVHVVGGVAGEAFRFIGPATHAVAYSGFEQAIVMVDEPHYRQHVPRLHEAAELVLVPSLRNPLEQWRAVVRACRHLLMSGTPHAVHLHGMLPWLAGTWAVRASGAKVPIFYSPHGSRSIGALRALGAFGMLLIRPVLRTTRSAAIVSVQHESRAFEHWECADVVESPVGDEFFNVRRNEARHPLVVTGGRDQAVRSAELVGQMAVSLSGEELRISFNWIGTVDELTKARLNAAGVGVFNVTEDADRAARLGAGWIHVASGYTHGFPILLAEAMAAGLPCVALDCLRHREVIRDAETGYLCKTQRDMIERIAMLVDDQELRVRIGTAARDEARRRFGRAGFGAKLLAAYAIPGQV